MARLFTLLVVIIVSMVQCNGSSSSYVCKTSKVAFGSILIDKLQCGDEFNVGPAGPGETTMVLPGPLGPGSGQIEMFHQTEDRNSPGYSERRQIEVLMDLLKAVLPAPDNLKNVETSEPESSTFGQFGGYEGHTHVGMAVQQK